MVGIRELQLLASKEHMLVVVDLMVYWSGSAFQLPHVLRQRFYAILCRPKYFCTSC